VRTSNLYRGLLLLYPEDFRRQFSEEMLCVFEQRAGEHFTKRGSLSADFVLAEFFSVMKGAYTMWLEKLSRIAPHPPAKDAVPSPDAPATIAELKSQRETAIQNMVASIATHDFVDARQYSYEETRLNKLLRGLQNEVCADVPRKN
jgi:hypothetical protein